MFLTNIWSNLNAKSVRVYFGEEGFSFDESSRENEAKKIRELNFTIDRVSIRQMLQSGF